jgi:hypothetical protein
MRRRAVTLTFDSPSDLASALRRAAEAHGRHEDAIGHPDPGWPDWYAAYLERQQAGPEHKVGPPAVRGGGLVPVAVVPSRTEAELIAGMLRDNDLRAVLSADDAGGQEPQLQAQGVRVLVTPAAAAAARQLLDAANRQGAGDDYVPDPPAHPRWGSECSACRVRSRWGRPEAGSVRPCG